MARRTRKFDPAPAVGCLLALAAAAVVGLLCLGLKNGCGRNYSDGQRSGELRKFSRKGVAWKSWEGALLQSNAYVRRGNEGGPDVWSFSVTDPSIAAKLESLPPGSLVTLRYRQWLIRPLTQDTDYDVIGVLSAPRSPPP